MNKIRIASKNFICEKCNDMITKGSTYHDYWNVTNDNYYYHKRFHIECINSNKIESKKSDIFERLLKALEKENGCIMANNNGIKCYVCGIRYNENGVKDILCETWGDKIPYYESVEKFKTYVDWQGKSF